MSYTREQVEEAREYLFRLVCAALHWCVGPDKAITLDQLAGRVKANRRNVEQCIEHNLNRFDFLLVADGHGYYQPTEGEQIDRYVHNLHSRHRRMQVREETTRAKALTKGWIEENGHFRRPHKTQQQELFICI